MTSPASPPPAAADDAVQAGRAVDKFDLEMVAFVLRWAPYGGPPADECMPLFGMPLDRLLARFCEIVCSGRRGHLGTDDRALLERAGALAVVNEVESPGRQLDQTSPPIGRPVLRRGVWRWA